MVETQLAGGDFLSDRTLLADDATAALRGTAALPSTATLSRFLGAATLGWTAKAAAVKATPDHRGRMLARAWAAGAAPAGPVITIDPDATRVATYTVQTADAARHRHPRIPGVGGIHLTGEAQVSRFARVGSREGVRDWAGVRGSAEAWVVLPGAVDGR